MKKQHADQIARGLAPDEQSGHGFQSDMPGSRVLMPYESPYSDVTTHVPTTLAPETPRLPLIPIVDENLSTPKAVSVCEPPPRPDIPESIASTSSKPTYESPCAVIISEVPTTGVSEMPRSAPSLTVDGITSTPSAEKSRGSPSTLYGDSDDQGDDLTNTQVADIQAVITSIWDRDVDILSEIIAHDEIDCQFGRAATSELVKELMEDRFGQSRRVLANRSIVDFTPMLRNLTPVKLAILIGFPDGVICLLGRETRHRPDLMQWSTRLPTANATIGQDRAITAFLSYHNRGITDAPAVDDSLFPQTLSEIRYQLADCGHIPHHDMPGGTKWLEHAIRRGNVAGAYYLLARGEREAGVLGDGTPLLDYALQNGQDKIAVLLFRPWAMSHLAGLREMSRSSTRGGGSYQSRAVALRALARLRHAAQSMKGAGDEKWQYNLEALVDDIRAGESGISGVPSMDWEDVKISDLLL
jgi:hypothetical protein